MQQIFLGIYNISQEIWLLHYTRADRISWEISPPQYFLVTKFPVIPVYNSTVLNNTASGEKY